MKTTPLGRILLLLGLGVALVGSPCSSLAASSVASEAASMGDNTFTITRTAKTAFTRDINQLKAEVQEDATGYCAAHGKQMVIVDLKAKKPFFSTGYAYATIVFKALTAAEIEQATHATEAPDSSRKPDGTGDLYTDILKLDDLRKRGLLTDAEFESEKKKILARSK